MHLENRMASERSQTSETMGCLIPSIQNVQNKPIHKDRKQMSGHNGQGKWGVMFNGDSFSLG